LQTLEKLPERGNYTLVIKVNGKIRLTLNTLGQVNLEKGYYAYTGSAQGRGAVSLKGRIARHLRAVGKTSHWHIDFLLANKKANVEVVVAAESEANRECKINTLLKKIEGATVPFEGFGASDCKQHCGSHLVHLGKLDPAKKIVDAYSHLFEYGRVLTLSLND
jgi:Uri superfamily endonuclease